jgi:tetratricopeptide (TPR) repeat protein
LNKLPAPLRNFLVRRFVLKYRALIVTGAGNFADARRLVAATPADCVDCMRARGRIDAMAGNVGAATFWFQRAIVAAPSVPFGYADLGELLLRDGKYDAAIAKFTLANTKGPHFADPLEMWGEALMQKNRSDLALAKFEEANTYAPNWGRLHLEWGKALFYARKKDVSQKQFALAASLDLSATDEAALAKWMAKHE